MNFKWINFLALALLLGLAAFRPWRTINTAAGLRNVADSVDVAGRLSDTVLVTQPIQVVLPPSTVDSLSAQLDEQKQQKVQLQVESKKLQKELTNLKKGNAEKQSALVSEQEIADLLAKQNGKRPAGESALERELNGPKTPK